MKIEVWVTNHIHLKEVIRELCFSERFSNTLNLLNAMDSCNKSSIVSCKYFNHNFTTGFEWGTSVLAVIVSLLKIKCHSFQFINLETEINYK